jgi:3-dehydroquinate synthase
MREINVAGCNVFLGESFEAIDSIVGERHCVFLVDKKVLKLHAQKFTGKTVIEVDAREEKKTIETAKNLLEKLIKLKTDREFLLVGVGGGITCDVCGFVASVFMRGISFGFVPTTLLAMTDASIGGKNGVNLMGFKNIVGTITFPEFVLIDFGFLKTLPENEIRCGMSETVKHALIADKKLFEYIEENSERIMHLHATALEKMVHDSILIKVTIVEKDANEKGERKKLNFGHTLGHALEKTVCIPHGNAVSIGMVFAAKFSNKKGLLGNEETKRIEEMLKKIGLCTIIPEKTCSKELLEAMTKDKKKCGKKIDFVFLKGIGNAELKKIDFGEIEECLKQSCSE